MFDKYYPIGLLFASNNFMVNMHIKYNGGNIIWGITQQNQPMKN